ncbi:PaaI family thioesterase [Curtanaerobium respiraculi]|jgi:1,4-dihydroxy-2-naphthoyl-CoA hydrolase|uniref:PaaI family thioesterase n=1 Tax=Curtanaerobium respiraculi TaxID=2949669 RepID=UPI0024B34A9D|nr:PaaI family thioesterase [Curtanaerobium respiraculi]
MAFTDMLNISIIREGKNRVVAEMPIVPELFQPHGFLHGGATLSLLETAASRGAELNADLGRELPFGTSVQVKHRKPGKRGRLRGVAELVCDTEYAPGARVQQWKVAAYDDAGDIVSEGTLETKIVSFEYFERKNMRRKSRG